jgi:hypothetical protein
VQYILTTPSCVLLMPCVFLALPGKENSRPVQHLFTSTYVFLFPFFSLHCLLKKQHIYATHSYNHDVFEFCMCSLHCLVKEQQTCATHSYNNLWCVLNTVCVPRTETEDLCKHIITTPSSVFLCRICPMYCLVKKQQAVVQYILQHHLVCFLMPCLFLALPVN